MTGRAIGPLAVEQLRQIYQRTAHLKPGQSADTRKEKIRVNRRQGRLTEDLESPAAVIGAAPTTARFEFLTEGADGHLHPTGIFNVVTNHDPGVSGANGDYVIVQRTDGLWMLSSAGGSGGGSNCCCSCVVVEPNLLHPGGFVTVRNWLFALESATGWGRVAADNGWIRIKAATYEVAWNETTAKWEYDLQVADAEFRNDGGEVGAPLTVTGQITTDWVSETDPVVTRIEWDGTGATYVEAPPP